METVLLPKFSPSKTIIEEIVCMLTEEWPLTTRGIFSRLQKNQNICSIQATYKAIKKLKEENLIEQDGKYYRLDNEWLKQINEFSKKIIDDYNTSPIKLNELP